MWRRLHRWIGLSIALALVPVAVTGSLLVWREHVDALLSPQLFAVSAPEMRQPLAQYVKNAAAAAPSIYSPATLRFPVAEGWPASVTLRKTGAAGNDLERDWIVYLDPPSGRVLGIANPRTNFTGTIRRLHRDLLIPSLSGRQIVGWIGVGLLALILSGLWLWWPRGGLLRGLRWRRGPRTASNLHYSGGFWIALPLAIVSLTGIYLSFPQTARLLTAGVAGFSPTDMRADRNSRVAARISPDEAAALLKSREPDARIASIVLPLRHRTPHDPGVRPVFWRIQATVHGASRSFLIDDASGQLTELPPPTGGNRFARIVHHLHEGEGFGAIWSTAVFLSGLLPALLAVTGFLMWARKRRRREQR